MVIVSKMASTYKVPLSLASAWFCRPLPDLPPYIRNPMSFFFNKEYNLSISTGFLACAVRARGCVTLIQSESLSRLSRERESVSRLMLARRIVRGNFYFFSQTPPLRCSLESPRPGRNGSEVRLWRLYVFLFLEAVENRSLTTEFRASGAGF